MDKKLSLPSFLKLLMSSGIPIAKAMAVASKVYNDFNTPGLLAQLDDARLQVLGIGDSDLRRLVLTAVRTTRSTQNPNSGGDGLASVQPAASSSSLGNNYPSAVQTLITPRKKRKRDDDLSELLPGVHPDEASAYGNMSFNDVLDEEVLKVKSAVINRAPLLTAWAMIVAERLGFEREEALSIGSVYTEMNATDKNHSLCIADESSERRSGPISGEQPYVDLLGRQMCAPLYRTQLSRWRALTSGSPMLPSTAFTYISRTFRQTAPYIIGALRLLAESYSPQELNKVGFSLYADFRPSVNGWGKRGEVRCERILSLRKIGGGEEQRGKQSSGSEEPPQKKARVFT